MDGLLLIDKESGMTSRDVVNIVGKILGTKKIGHTGTLDPMATGVLVLCVGKATKACDMITNYNKEYIAEVTLGLDTDTLDITGNIIKEESTNISKEELNIKLKDFIGNIKQEVPKYSAIKINGKKLYEYARQNIDIKLPTRDIKIFNIELIGDIKIVNNRQTFIIKCSVSKGTYIRSLVRDIGYSLGTFAVMSSLRRTKQGNYLIEDCEKIDDIKQGLYKMISLDDIFFDMETIIAQEDLLKRIKNGAIIDRTFINNMVKIVYNSNNVIAIYQIDPKDSTKARPYKMFL